MYTRLYSEQRTIFGYCAIFLTKTKSKISLNFFLKLFLNILNVPMYHLKRKKSIAKRSFAPLSEYINIKNIEWLRCYN